MAKKTQDLKPDTILKNYWRDNAQFADIFNAVLFEGRQVILPEELEDVDTEESSVMEHRDYACYYAFCLLWGKALGWCTLSS